MNFDWVQFLDRNSVEYATSGPNVSKNNVAIACPLCGDDPSQHMVISTIGYGWWCWRNRSHKGKSPVRLVQALLHCSFEQAHNIVEGSTFLPDDFHGQVMALLGPTPPPDSREPLSLPDTFKRLGRQPSARPAINYLKRRNFTDKQIDRFYNRHGIVYCSRGAFKGRIIFPITFEGRLVTWTGRSVSPNAMVRYKTLSNDPEKAAADELPPALAPINNYLLWWDHLIDCDADTIILVEGPFDALKVTTLGWTRGIVATCFFTQSPGPLQIDLLHELLPKYEKKFLLLDQGTIPALIKIAAELQTLGVEPLRLPVGLKDPGELTGEQLEELA
jgi:hypothetical protein